MLLSWLQTWSGPISEVLAACGGWYAKVARDHAQVRRDRLDAGTQALQLVASYQARETALIAERERSLAYEMDARARARIAADVLQEVHAEAISARVRCHDLEMRAGLPLTDFPLFPDFPFREVSLPVQVATQEEHRTNSDGCIKPEKEPA